MSARGIHGTSPASGGEPTTAPVPGTPMRKQALRSLPRRRMCSAGGRRTSLPGLGGGTMTVLRFATHLWFDDQAEDAARFYTSLFENSHVDKATLFLSGLPDCVEEGSWFI